MGIVIKQSIRNSIISYSGASLGAFTILWVFPSLLSLSEIGLWRTIIDTSTLIATILCAGLPRSIIKFHSEASLKYNLEKTYFNSVLLFSIVLSGTGIIVLWMNQDILFEFFNAKAPNVNEHWEKILCLAFIIPIKLLFDSFSVASLKTIAPNFIQDVLLRVLNISAVCLYGIGYIDFDWLLSLIYINYGIGVIALIATLVLQREYGFELHVIRMPLNLVKKTAGFSTYSFLGFLVGSLIYKIDSIMVSSKLGLEENGIYTTALFFTVLMELPSKSIAAIASPLISKFFKTFDIQAVEKLYRQTSINSLSIGILMYLGVIVNLDYLGVIIPNWDMFLAGKTVIILLGLAKLFTFTFGMGVSIIDFSNHYKFNLIGTTYLATVTVVSNWLLIPRMGINGAALATVLSIGSYQIINFIFVLKKLRMNPLSFSFFKVIIIGACSFCLTLLIPTFEHDVLNIFCRSLTVLFSYIFLIYFYKVSDEINVILNKYTKALLNRIS